MRFLKRWQFWAVVIAPIVVIAIVYSFFGRSDIQDDPTEVPLSEVISEAQAGNVEEIEVDGTKLTILMADGRELTSRKERDTSMVDVLLNLGVKVGGEDGVTLTVEGRGWGGWIGIIITFLPLLLFGGLIVLGVRWAARRP